MTDLSELVEGGAAGPLHRADRGQSGNRANQREPALIVRAVTESL